MTYKSVSIDIDLDDFDDDELIEEIECRGYTVDSTAVDQLSGYNISEMIEQLHQLRRTGQDYQQVLDRLIYNSIGKII
jgi:hypothetical protein